MKKRMKIVILGIIALLVLTSFPSAITHKTKNIEKQQYPPIDALFPRKRMNDNDTIKMCVINCKKDGNVEKTIKQLTFKENEELLSKIYEIAQLNFSIKQKLEAELNLLKKYNLISDNTKLEDFFDLEKLDELLRKIKKFDNVTMQNFQAHFAPLLVVGGGFGVGIGLPDQRIYNGFTNFLALIGGLAFVLCLDFIEGVRYTLISYMLPVLIGYIAGYMGIILFAIYPGFFYANLVMIGLAPYTIWIQVPNPNPDSG